MGGAVIPSDIVWPGASQHWWVGSNFPKMATHFDEYSCDFASNVFPPQWAPTVTTVFLGGPLRPAPRSDSDSYGASALPWDPVHMKPCVHLSRMGSLPPVLWSSCVQPPLAFTARCSSGSFTKGQIPRCGPLPWVSELSSCMWVSVIQLLSSLWGFPPWRYCVAYIT